MKVLRAELHNGRAEATVSVNGVVFDVTVVYPPTQFLDNFVIMGKVRSGLLTLNAIRNIDETQLIEKIHDYMWRMWGACGLCKN